MKARDGVIILYNHEYEELRIIQIKRMSDRKFEWRKRPIVTDS